jgi:hypothetical protein
MDGFTKPRGTDVGGQRAHPHSHPRERAARIEI